jgi:hypothetical protein
LNIIKTFAEWIGLSIPKNWAKMIINDFHLNLTQRNYNISGEKSAIFEFESEIIRIEHEWTGGYKLYHNDWKPNPHWTGD